MAGNLHRLQVLFYFFFIPAIAFINTSQTAPAATLLLPDVPIGPITHQYANDFDWWDPSWGPCLCTQIIDTCWLENGPSLCPDAPTPYFDSVQCAITPGAGNKFRINVPAQLSSVSFFAFMVLQPSGSAVPQEIPLPAPALMPDWYSVSLIGPSGETVLTTQEKVNVFVTECEAGDGKGKALYADASLTITENLEFSRIEFSCYYSGGIPYPLDNGKYTFTDGGIVSHLFEQQALPDLPLISNIPVPEPSSLLLLETGVLFFRSKLRKPA